MPTGRPVAVYAGDVARGKITEALVAQLAADLRAKYGLDDDDLRIVGVMLSEHAGARSANLAFAERFVAEHQTTFDRLAR
jgi:hypothetical protein